MDTFYIALGDASPVMEADLVDASGTVLIEDVDEVKLYVVVNAGSKDEYTATVVDLGTGTVQVQFNSDSFPRAGTYKCYFRNETKSLRIPNHDYKTISVIE